MMKANELTPVKTENAPLPIGPYSQAIIANGLVFCSGQVGIDPQTGEMAIGDVEGQARQMFLNLKAVAEASGSNLGQAIKCTLFLRSMDDFAKVNKIYAEFFSPPFPARSTVAVAGLPRDALCEIEAVLSL